MAKIRTQIVAILEVLVKGRYRYLHVSVSADNKVYLLHHRYLWYLPDTTDTWYQWYLTPSGTWNSLKKEVWQKMIGRALYEKSTFLGSYRCEPRRFTLWMRPMLNRTVTFKRSVMSSWENFHDDPALQSNEDGVGNSGPLLRMDRTHRSLTILGHAKYRILRPVECMDAYAERSVTDRGEWWHWLGIEYCSLFFSTLRDQQVVCATRVISYFNFSSLR